MIAGAYPAASETFVWREVEAIRQRGGTVVTVGLHPPDQPAAGVGAADLLVYGPQAMRTWAAMLAELVSHPLQTARTLTAAIVDAISPGEPTGLTTRLKVIVQAKAAVGLARRLRQYAVRHIHCHFAHAPTSVGMYAAMQLAIPFTFTGHANDLFQRRALLRRKLQRATGVACISQWHAQWYASIERDCASRCRIVRCGVAIPDERRTAIFDGPLVRVICVGRLVGKKGFDVLIRAFAKLHDNQPNRWRLTIVGDGPLGHDLRELSAELDCESAVSFAGAMSHERVRAMLGEADMFVMPCRTDAAGDRDGIPVAIMEAMAVGLAVIAGDVPAIRELVVDGQTGVMVESEPTKVAEQMAKLAEDADGARRLAAAGREHVATEFSTDVNVSRLLEMIEQA